MYKRILVPTDGSKLSTKAVKAAAKLAKAFRAKLTGVYVTPPYVTQMHGEAGMYVPAVLPKPYKEMMRKEANKALALVKSEARAAGVACATLTVTADQAWQGIIRASRSRRCDLIVMASHGRRGLAALLLGSETTKVLTHSKVPVLVYR